MNPQKQDDIARMLKPTVDAIEASCQRNNVVMADAVKLRVLECLMEAYCLEEVIEGNMEIVGFQNGELVFK